ncbi:TPA: hypothetical protein ACJOGX_001993 [Enterobacter kobei]
MKKIIFSKKIINEIYKCLNLILVEKNFASPSFISVINSFRISDLSSMDDIRPSFANLNDLNHWAGNNGYRVDEENRYGYVSLVGQTNRTASFNLIYCKKEFKNYRAYNIKPALKTLMQSNPKKRHLIHVFDEIKIVLSDIKKHNKFNKKLSNELDSLIDYVEIKVNSFRCALNDDSEIIDFELILKFLDVDHVKCKSSANNDEWILMFPIAPWVNREIGRRFERKKSLENLKLSNIGFLNSIQIIKIFACAVPPNNDSECVIKFAEILSKMSSRTKDESCLIKKSIYRMYNMKN